MYLTVFGRGEAKNDFSECNVKKLIFFDKITVVSLQNMQIVYYIKIDTEEDMELMEYTKEFLYEHKKKTKLVCWTETRARAKRSKKRK